jgi:hypothetical protein
VATQLVDTRVVLISIGLVSYMRKEVIEWDIREMGRGMGVGLCRDHSSR